MRDLSLHLMDVVRNSVDAGAGKIEIYIEADIQEDILKITVKDNGRGMEDSTIKKVTDPFYTTRTTRKVGLGIPLFVETCRRSQGDLTIKSELGKGTEITAVMKISSIDRPPIGDIGNTVAGLQASETEIDYVVGFKCGDKDFTYSTEEVRQVLGNEVSLDNPQVIGWIEESITEGLENIFGGVLNEIPCRT